MAPFLTFWQEETRDETHAAVVYRNGWHVAESLVAALVAHGFGVREIRPERADLETLFLQLTHTEAPACVSS